MATHTVDIADLYANGVPSFWASVLIADVTLTPNSGTATLTENDAYTVTLIDKNAAGTKGTADKWGILGGFDFVAPRTGYYQLRGLDAMMQLQSASSGMAGFLRITQDTSAPTQNNDSTNDTGTTVPGGLAGATTAGAGWADTIDLAVEPPPVLLTADTHYYFTLQAKYQGAGSATGFNISSISGATASLSIRELPVQ